MRSPSEGLGARTATDEFGGTQFGPRQTTGGKGKSPHPDCETGGPSHCAPGPLGPRGVVNTTLRVVNTTEGD